MIFTELTENGSQKGDKMGNKEVMQDKSKPRNFNPDEEFFVIDSDSLQSVESELYGFCIINGSIVNSIDALLDIDPSPDGAYVYIKREGDIITIRQDYVGCYGLYLYRDEDYFALSNSFIYLVDHIKAKHKITFNKPYADYFISVDLCVGTYSETMINEISILDRCAVVEINIQKHQLSWHYVDYKENSVELDTVEGMRILDGWYHKWTEIIKHLFENNNDIIFDLSGGFDSRITFLLAAASGIDLNKVLIRSVHDKLHTHAEDYEIASAIAEHFGFSLNNENVVSHDSYNCSVNDIFNISLYAKECFCKQMYFKYTYEKKPRFIFTGNGGEYLRDADIIHFHESLDELIDKLVSMSKRYNFAFSAHVEESIKKIMEDTFALTQKKFRDFGRPFENEASLSKAAYRETRCRNHFGRQAIEYLQSNTFCLSPLLDSDLHKIKPILQGKEAKGIVFAVILDRYCSDLLDFKFDGNRSFSDATIQYAKKINYTFPYVKKQFFKDEIEIKIKTKNKEMYPFEKTAPFVLSETAKKSFYSEEVRTLFMKYYNKEVYDHISDVEKIATYFPLADVYAVLGICKILKDTEVNRAIFSSPADDIIDCIDNQEKPSSMCDYSLLDNYVVQRVDIKNSGSDTNDIKILDISDDKAIVKSPEWFNRKGGGTGYTIQSRADVLRLHFRIIKNGTLDIWLRTLDVRDENGKREQFQIDFQTLIINGNVIFDNVHGISHDKPFRYTQAVADGDEILIEIHLPPFDIKGGVRWVKDEEKTIQELPKKTDWHSKEMEEKQMTISTLKSKIHRAVITQAELNYVGSITIDEDLMEASGIAEYEHVHIVNVNSGSRIETYVIAGERGSGVICLNGAAARCGQKGDFVIIMSYADMTPEEIKNNPPKVVFVDEENHIYKISRYEKHGRLVDMTEPLTQKERDD